MPPRYRRCAGHRSRSWIGSRGRSGVGRGCRSPRSTRRSPRPTPRARTRTGGRAAHAACSIRTTPSLCCPRSKRPGSSTRAATPRAAGARRSITCIGRPGPRARSPGRGVLCRQNASRRASDVQLRRQPTSPSRTTPPAREPVQRLSPRHRAGSRSVPASAALCCASWRARSP